MTDFFDRASAEALRKQIRSERAARRGDALPGRVGTVIIDDPEAGGSEAGTWERAIAHTPALAAQVAGDGK